MLSDLEFDQAVFLASFLSKTVLDGYQHKVEIDAASHVTFECLLSIRSQINQLSAVSTASQSGSILYKHNHSGFRMLLFQDDAWFEHL